MKTAHELMLLLVTALAGPCLASESNTLSRSEQNLRAIWTSTNATVQQRAAAVNSCFTNGTPINQVLSVVGKWDEHHQTFTTSDPSELNCRVLVYRFGSERITIRAKGTPDIRTEVCEFAGALAWKPTDFGQHRGSADRSQPIHSETNQAKVPAGAGR
jgi:hypothetical protein